MLPLLNNSVAASHFTFLEIPVHLRWLSRGIWILCPGKNTAESFPYSLSASDSFIGLTQVSVEYNAEFLFVHLIQSPSAKHSKTTGLRTKPFHQSDALAMFFFVVWAWHSANCCISSAISECGRVQVPQYLMDLKQSSGWFSLGGWPLVFQYDMLKRRGAVEEWMLCGVMPKIRLYWLAFCEPGRYFIYLVMKKEVLLWYLEVYLCCCGHIRIPWHF